MERLGRAVLLVLAVAAVAACGSDSSPEPQDHLACGTGTVVAPGNQCCADGRQRPDCTLAVSHSGYWESSCAAPLSPVCEGQRDDTFEVAEAGTLIALYTTGSFHVMPGEVRVTLDGVDAGIFEAALPGGTVNEALELGHVDAGTHTIVLRFASTNEDFPTNWGGFLDLFVRK